MNVPHLNWRKSSRSNEMYNCVEVAFADQAVLARDSKRPGAGALSFSPGAWHTFVTGLRADRFTM